jgi:hypothetical protein
MKSLLFFITHPYLFKLWGLVTGALFFKNTVDINTSQELIHQFIALLNNDEHYH